MNAYETSRAKQTSFYAVKGGWSVVFTLSGLTQKFVEAMHLMHRHNCKITIVPHDADSLFSQDNSGEVKKTRWTASQEQRMAIKQLWIASGSKVPWDEYYKTQMEKIRVYIDLKTIKINGEKK